MADRIRATISDFRSGSITRGDLLSRVCRLITEETGATRASIWLFNDDQDAIQCICLYDSRDGSVVDGTEIREQDFEPYFEALKMQGKVVAPDALTHPATQCFADTYFAANDIVSLLDHVIISGGAFRAVLCCEHCGEHKQWTEEDMNFLLLLSAQIGTLL